MNEPSTLGGDTRILLELLGRWAALGAIRATIVTSAGRRETCARYQLPEGVAYQFCPDTHGVRSFAGHLRAASRLRHLASCRGRGRLKGWRHSYDGARFTLRGIASSPVWLMHDGVNFDAIASTPEQQPFDCGCKGDSRLAPTLSWGDGARVPVSPRGLRLTVPEAMACGRPVACSRTTTTGETTGDAALTFDPADVSDIARALRLLLGNEGLRRDLAQRGVKQAAQVSWERTARETVRVYDEVI